MRAAFAPKHRNVAHLEKGVPGLEGTMRGSELGSLALARNFVRTILYFARNEIWNSIRNKKKRGKLFFVA